VAAASAEADAAAASAALEQAADAANAQQQQASNDAKAAADAAKAAADRAAENPDDGKLQAEAAAARAAEEAAKSALEKAANAAKAAEEDTASKPSDAALAEVARKALETAEADKAKEMMYKKRSDLAQEISAKSKEEAARKLAIMKKLAKAASLAADKAATTDKANELQEKVDESKVKSKEADATSKKAKIDAEGPDNKVQEAIKKQQDLSKENDRVEKKFNDANNKFNEAKRLAGLAETKRKGTKERMEKSEAAFEVISGPYSQAADAEKEASARVDDAAAKLRSLQSGGELDYLSLLDMSTVLDTSASVLSLDRQESKLQLGESTKAAARRRRRRGSRERRQKKRAARKLKKRKARAEKQKRQATRAARKAAREKKRKARKAARKKKRKAARERKEKHKVDNDDNGNEAQAARKQARKDARAAKRKRDALREARKVAREKKRKARKVARKQARKEAREQEKKEQEQDKTVDTHIPTNETVDTHIPTNETVDTHMPTNETVDTHMPTNETVDTHMPTNETVDTHMPTNKTRMPASFAGMSRANNDADTTEAIREQENEKRRNERIQERNQKSDEKKRKYARKLEEVTERTSKAQEKRAQAEFSLKASSELKKKAAENAAKAGKATTPKRAKEKTTKSGELHTKSMEALESNKELVSKSGEKQGKSTEAAARAKERAGKGKEKEVKAQSALVLLKAGEEKSEVRLKKEKSSAGNEAKSKATVNTQMVEEGTRLQSKENMVAAEQATALSEQKQIAKSLEDMAAAKEAAAEGVQKASMKEKQSEEAATGTAVTQKELDAKASEANARAKLANEKAVKSATANKQLEAQVASVMNETTANNLAMKNLAGQEVGAYQAFEAAQAKSKMTAEEASTASVASQNADESAAKAAVASQAAQKKSQQAAAERQTVTIKAESAVTQVGKDDAAALNAENDKKVAQLKSEQLEDLSKVAISAQQEALAKVEDANAAASKSGSRYAVTMQTSLKGLKKSDFNMMQETAFGHAVASALKLDTEQVAVVNVTGATRLTVHYTISAGNYATGTSYKSSMASMDNEKFMKLFQKAAEKLGASVDGSAEVGQTSGSVVETKTNDQIKAVQEEREAKQHLTDATNKAASASQALLQANERASETKQVSLNAQSEKEKEKEQQGKDVLAFTYATDQANLTASAAATQEQSKTNAAEHAQTAGSSALEAASLTKELGQKLAVIKSKLKVTQTDQERLGQELDQATAKGAVVNIAAQNDAEHAKEVGSDATRLTTEMTEADSAATQAVETYTTVKAMFNEKEAAVHTDKNKEASLIAQDQTARQKVEAAVKVTAAVQEEATKENAHKKMAKEAEKSEEKVQEAKNNAASESPQAEVIEVEVTNKLEGIKASEFEGTLKTAFQSATAASLGVDTDKVKIGNVQDTSELLVQSLGDSSDGNSGIAVTYSVKMNSEAAAGKLKGKVDALAPADLMKTFQAEAASLGAEVPPGVTASAPISKIREEKSGAPSTAAQVEAASQLLKAEKVQLEITAAKAKKFKKEFDGAKDKFEASQQTFKKAEQNALDLAAAQTEAENKLKAEKAKKDESEKKMEAMKDELKVDKDGAEAADISAKKDDVIAQVMAGKASGKWSEFLKAAADKKTAEAAGGKSKKESTQLDSWSVALARTVQQAGPCAGVANKFQTIIAGARDEYVNKTKHQCIAKGKHWAEQSLTPIAQQPNSTELGESSSLSQLQASAVHEHQIRLEEMSRQIHLHYEELSRVKRKVLIENDKLRRARAATQRARQKRSHSTLPH